MNLISQYSPVADAVIERANKVQMQEGEQFDTIYWHGNPDEKAKEAPYEPTGYTKFDDLIRRVNPRFRYGGDNASNVIVGAFMFQYMRDALDNEFHYVEIPHAKDFTSREHYAMVLAHEMGHWAGIRDKTIPLSGAGSGSAEQIREGNARMPQEYAIDEMAADIFAALILKWAGIAHPEEEAMAKRIHAAQSHISPFDKINEAGLIVARDRAVAQFVRLLDMAGEQQ